MSEIKFGVSPAYQISRYGDRFTPENVAESLSDLSAQGYSSFQLEVFHPETLNDWAYRGINKIAEAAAKFNIYPSQFVGHFLLHGFESAEALESEFGIVETRVCLDLLKPFPDCSVITVAIPGFTVPTGRVDRAGYKKLWDRFAGKIKTMLAIAEDGGKKLALEILPGSILGGLQGLLRLIDQFGSVNFGYNLDTGHAWASRELVGLVPAMLDDRIFGTHLKDNAQAENLSLAPGRGTIPWDILVPNLLNSAYRGSWDIEIKCESGDVASEYEQGLKFLKSKINVFKGV
ncbi:hypothetical protein AGMMS49546_13360 [Spirochaetia bacterium]|nr:hypothetical protein AGMMS49546_13360 [Spirochaetia bacterium]